LARQYYEALNAEGFTDATQHFRHPDIEMFDPPDFPDADRYVGEAALRKLIASYLELGWDGQFRVQNIWTRERRSWSSGRRSFVLPMGRLSGWRERSGTYCCLRAEGCAGSGST
jgi:hypothetical protein